MLKVVVEICTAAMRSVVAEEMEKCMKSIEHSLLERKKGTMF